MANEILKLSLVGFCFILGVVFSLPDCPEKCPEGKSINITCNTCGCNNGTWICTLIACHVKECDPYKYRSDCDNCECHDGEWKCDGCPGTCGHDCPTCKHIKIGCNTCSCNDGGWACTKIGCPFKECDPKCYREDCDECECKDAKWDCKCCRKPCDDRHGIGRRRYNH